MLFRSRNNDLSKVNNDLTDHQVAMMHLFNKNKKKSPKHFLHEDSLSKEHLQLLQKVESMQFLKEGFPPYGRYQNYWMKEYLILKFLTLQ